MPVRRSVLLVSLLAVTVAGTGCTRKQTRNDPLRRQAVPPPPPGEARPIAAGQQPFPMPTPPEPPPLPQPNRSPRAEAVATVPRTEPTAAPALLSSPGSPAPVAQAQGADPAPSQEQRTDTAPGVPTLVATPAPSAAPAPAADPVRELLANARKRYATVADFEARLVKREVVHGKPQPQDEIVYKFRKQPLSVFMKVLSEAGQGREVIFVKGRDDRGMHVLTGKGDSRLVPAGFKTTVDPDGPDATSKSRYRIYEAGFGRTFDGLARSLDAAAKGGCTVTAVGTVQRPEFPYPLECVKVSTTNTSRDSVVSGGGTRSVYFDPKPDSPSYLMPVLVETHDLNRREVEYYWFDRLKLPAGLTDADFDPNRLGQRK